MIQNNKVLINLIRLLEEKENCSLHTYLNKHHYTIEELIDFLLQLGNSAFVSLFDEIIFTYEGKELNIIFDNMITSLNLNINELIEIINDKNFIVNNKNIYIRLQLDSNDPIEFFNLEDIKKYMNDINIDKIKDVKLKYYIKEDDDDYIDLSLYEIKNNYYKYKDIIIESKASIELVKALKSILFIFDKNEIVEIYNTLLSDDLIDSTVSKKIINILSSNEYEIYKKIIDREVIKIPNMNIKLNMDKLLSLYDIILEGKIVNLFNIKTNKIISSVILKKLYYDINAYNWKVQYIRKGNVESIRLDYLSDDIDESVLESRTGVVRKENSNVTFNQVKLRVFNEFNSKEKALRYAVKYKMKIIQINEEFMDLEICIKDNEQLLRWVRTMTPSVVILSPNKLKDKMKEELVLWSSIYSL